MIHQEASSENPSVALPGNINATSPAPSPPRLLATPASLPTRVSGTQDGGHLCGRLGPGELCKSSIRPAPHVAPLTWVPADTYPRLRRTLWQKVPALPPLEITDKTARSKHRHPERETKGFPHPVFPEHSASSAEGHLQSQKCKVRACANGRLAW